MFCYVTLSGTQHSCSKQGNRLGLRHPTSSCIQLYIWIWTNTSDLQLLPPLPFLWCPQIIHHSNCIISGIFCNNSEKNSIKTLLEDSLRRTPCCSYHYSVLVPGETCHCRPFASRIPWFFHLLGWSTSLWPAFSALHFRNSSSTQCRFRKAENHNAAPYHPQR